MTASVGNPPEAPPLSPIAQRVQGLVAEFSEQLQAKRDERAVITQRHEQELAEVDDDIALLEQTVAGLTGKAVPKKAPSKKPQPRRVGRVTGAGTATGFGVSLEVAMVAANAIKKMVREKEERGEGPAFTQKEFYRYPDIDWDQAKGSQAIRFMRHVGFLRKAGRSDATQAELWAIMDEDAVEAELRKAEQRTEEYEREVAARAIGGDPLDRVVEALQAAGEVHGWNNLSELTGIPAGTLSGGYRNKLTQANRITVENPGAGHKVIIRAAEPAEDVAA